MKEKYSLEIYYPRNVRDTWVAFYSDTPFQAINRGDIVSTASFPDATAGKVLRVVGIEHIIWASEGNKSKHKVCVFTEEVDQDDESYLNT